MAPVGEFSSRSRKVKKGVCELAPLWTRLGMLLYKHGGALYNFQGLREGREK
jgi:lysylphosphatidylglycerol synthetase-like protein (DUF2156 family)